MRSVVLLCEHNASGSFGFVLNRQFEQRLDDLIPGMEGYSIPVYYGGPVQTDTLHFIHSLPHLISDGQQVAGNVYWGGNFEDVLALVRQRSPEVGRIRFFLGYSGWGSGQLAGEMKEKSWLTVPAKQSLVFHEKAADIWRLAVKQLDEKFHEIINYPIDPQLN